MKRLLSMLFLLVLLTFNCMSYAEAIDLSSYADEEIIEMLTLVNQELISRHIEKTANLPKGSFVVGVDIPAGQYVYAHKRTDGWSAYIKLYEDETRENRVFSDSVAQGGTYYLNLAEGNVFESDEEFTLTIRPATIFQ